VQRTKSAGATSWPLRLLQRLQLQQLKPLRPLSRHRIIVILTSLLCLYLPAAAQPAPLQSQESQQPPHGALYKITLPGHTLYLFGTMHVGRADFFPLEPKVMHALKHASVLALELDPSRTDAIQSALRRYGIATESDGSMPAALKTRRDALLQHYGIGSGAMATMQPWLQATTLVVAEFTANGYQPRYSVDDYLLAQFKKTGKPVRQLESAESQLALLGGLSRSDQIQFLDDTITELEDPAGAQEAIAMANLWRDADSPGLAALLKKLGDDGTFSSRFTLDVLLKQRNPHLADGLADLLRENRNSFAAIGVLHLVGPDNVPALLQQRGYRVEQIY
jgi:uncharacterized protein YbaP (TraB family)